MGWWHEEGLRRTLERTILRSALVDVVYLIFYGVGFAGLVVAAIALR